MAEYAIVKWVMAHWRALALGVVLLGLTGWHFQDKISDWWDDRKIKNLTAQVESLTGEVAALKAAQAAQEAASQAARAAGERNDREIPKARAAAAERAGRAATADRDQRVSDVQAATGDYSAAAGGLQGKRAR